ncbi:MAG: Exonuclease RNase T and DNA polymerase III, partial [Parcubacteria group bacterium GW2011_GWA1_47_10]
PAFEGSEMKGELRKLLKDGIMVAHNAPFDIAMLKTEGLEVPRFIDTLRVARHLDAENKIPEYNLQFLRYYLDLDIEADAHDAEADVRVLEAVFKRLQAKMPDVQELIEISSRPTLFKNFIFGKYKGQPIADVARTDRRYLEWLLAQKSENEEAEEDWIFTLKHYLAI